ncbi:MAG: outer membrane protein assembly factor BamC [Immundisolibacteraceae bacterium]|nr:outer membrane protein assembly factor BamC [Immundisolibacteraceae bacterium]
MTRSTAVLRSAGLAGLAFLTLSGCSTVEKYLTGDPADKEYQAATKLPPLEIPPEMNRGVVDSSGALRIPGIDDNYEVSYSAQYGAVQSGPRRQREAISFLSSDDTGASTLRVSGGFATAWTEVASALAKLGVEVTHRNREKGEYRVDFPVVGEVNRGVVDTLVFWNNDEVQLANLEIIIENLGEPTTLVRVYDGNDLDASATATTLLEKMHTQMSPAGSVAASTTNQRPLFETAGKSSVAAPVSLTATPGRRYQLENRSGAGRIVTDQGFARAWREVGLAIAEQALDIEDRDRSRGVYFINDLMAQQSGGLVSKLKFWGDDDAETITRLVVIQPQDGGGSQVLIFDEEEHLDGSPAAKAMLANLHKHLP